VVLMQPAVAHSDLRPVVVLMQPAVAHSDLRPVVVLMQPVVVHSDLRPQVVLSLRYYSIYQDLSPALSTFCLILHLKWQPLLEHYQDFAFFSWTCCPVQEAWKLEG
jgi:hypothetical protein